MPQSITVQQHMPAAELPTAHDPRALTPAAPIVYNDDGSVAWDRMWGSCMRRYLAWETATARAWQRLRRWFGR